MGIIESEVLPRSDYFIEMAIQLRSFRSKIQHATGAPSSETTRGGERFLESGRSRVCMTDSGAIESDLERFQKTFSRSPTYKAALSPRERRAVRHETSRTTIETRRTYTRTHACTCTYNSDDEEDEGGAERRGERQKENGVEGEGG